MLTMSCFLVFGIALDEPMIVYRGQTVAATELDNIKANIGRLISLNSFISTTPDRQFAEMMSGFGEAMPVLASVLFEIHIDRTNTKHYLPFADITHLSIMQKEKEVLLSMGSVLRIETVFMDNTTHINLIRLTLCSHENVRLSELKQTMGIGCYAPPLVSQSYSILSLARILIYMGEYDKASRLYHLAREHYRREGIHDIYFDIIFDMMRPFFNISRGDYSNLKASDFTSAIEQLSQQPSVPKPLLDVIKHLQSLLSKLSSAFQLDSDIDPFESIMNVHRTVRPSIENISSVMPPSTMDMLSIAHQYEEKEDHQHALAVFEKLLKAQEETLGKNHPQCANTLELMAYTAEQMGKVEQVIDYYMQILSMNEPSLSNDADRRLHANRMLADLFEERNDFGSALQFYENIISMPHFPVDDIRRVNALHSSARIYARFQDFQRALAYRQRAMHLQQECKNSLIARTDKYGCDSVLCDDPFYITASEAKHMGMVDAALDIYKQSLNIEYDIPEYDRRRRIWANNAIGFVLEKRQDYKRALESYENIVSDTSQSPVGWNHHYEALLKCASINEKLDNLTLALSYLQCARDNWKQHCPQRTNFFVEQQYQHLENKIKQKDSRH